MANSVEDALNRANAEQRERAEQTIEEARRNIQTSNMQVGDISSTEAANVARQAQIIEDAKRSIPFETMQHVNEVGPPMNTPPMHAHVNSAPIEVNPATQARIETIQQTGGNNYRNENAVDRALQRQAESHTNMDYTPYIAPEHNLDRQQQQELGH